MQHMCQSYQHKPYENWKSSRHVSCRVCHAVSDKSEWLCFLQVDRATHSMDLSQQDVDSGRPGGGRPPPPGSLVTGRVTAAGGFGLRLRLAGGFVGTVGLCDIHDTYVANALAGAPRQMSHQIDIPKMVHMASARSAHVA